MLELSLVAMNTASVVTGTASSVVQTRGSVQAKTAAELVVFNSGSESVRVKFMVDTLCKIRVSGGATALGALISQRDIS